MILSQQNKGVLALVVLAWVFATMGIFARYLSIDFQIFEQTYLRIGIAFLIGILLFYKHLNFKKFTSLSKRDCLVLILRSISLYLGIVLFTEALLSTKYSNASFIATLPLLPLFGYFLLGESLKLKTVFYVIIGFLGFSLITISDLSNFHIGYGELIAFGSMIFFDLSYIGRRWHSNYLNNYESTVFMFAVGAIFLFLTSLFVGEGLPSSDSFTLSVLGVLIIGAVFNVANLFLTNYGFQHVKVGIAGNILILETVFALLYSLFLYHEIPVLREVIGGALILVSVYLVNKSESN